MAKFIIEIDESVIICMILNGLESFLLPKLPFVKIRKSEKTYGHEIDGYIFGTKREESERVKYKVKYLNINTTSLSNQDYIRPEDHAKDLKRYLFKSLFPRTIFLGTFHTHPYRLRKRYCRGFSDKFFSGMYMPSEGDRKFGGEPNELDLILAIINAQRKLTQGIRYANNDRDKYCVQFDIANIRLFLGAYVRNGVGKSFYPYCDVELIIPEILNNLPENYDFDHLSKLLKI